MSPQFGSYFPGKQRAQRQWYTGCQAAGRRFNVPTGASAVKENVFVNERRYEDVPD